MCVAARRQNLVRIPLGLEFYGAPVRALPGKTRTTASATRFWTPRYPFNMIEDGELDLLILGCSGKKRQQRGQAIDVYDGPLFRTVRRRITEIGRPLDILIISARHGIIRQDHVIDPYDETLPKSENPEFANRVASELIKMLPLALKSVLILAPRHYVAHLPLDIIRLRSTDFDVYSGRIGKCQARLLDWLGIDYHTEPRKPNSLGPLSSFSTPIDASEIQQAAKLLAITSISSNRVTQWYALIDNHHVPVKRLVATLTGAPVSSFETCHALALLHRNGIETSRVGVG
ncbi:hypothetical protein QPK87_11020 [Kamptonema cortianum]|nr:hypothetical protein [Kamptonema cortianum]